MTSPPEHWAPVVHQRAHLLADDLEGVERQSAPSAFNETFDLVRDSVYIRLYIEFPEPHYNPAVSGEGRVRSPITGHVSGYLGDPVRRVMTALQLRDPGRELAAVPEVSVAEDDYTRGAKDDVWPSRQSGSCNAVAQPAREQGSTQCDLRERIALSACATRSRAGAR